MDEAVVKARIAWKLEKYDESGKLVETVTGEDEATPEEAEKLAALRDALPDSAVKGGGDGAA